MTDRGSDMNKPEPVTLLYVAEPGPEPGSEPMRLSGPLTPWKVNAALERLTEQHPAAFVLAVCDAT